MSHTYLVLLTIILYGIHTHVEGKRVFDTFSLKITEAAINEENMPRFKVCREATVFLRDIYFS